MSALSTYEYVSLIAQHHSINQGETVDPRLLDRGFSDEQLKILQAQAHTSVMGNVTRSLNVRISGDLNRFNFDYFSYVLSMYNVYEKAGTLPYKGSTSEQPAKIIEIFNLLDQLNFEYQKEERRKIEKEQRNNGRR